MDAGPARGSLSAGPHFPLVASVHERAHSMRADVDRIECNKLFRWVVNLLPDTSFHPLRHLFIALSIIAEECQ
jgi:hypothetical protein